jgi:hypothetical protein
MRKLALGALFIVALAAVRFSFAAPPSGDLPTGWMMAGSDPTDYKAALDQGKRKVQPFDNLTISVSEGLNRVAAELWVADECPPQPQALWRGERHTRRRRRRQRIVRGWIGRLARSR